MKKCLILTLLLFAGVIGFTQGSIKGKLTDTVNKQSLGLATVTVFEAGDTSLVTYRLTNPDGEFRVPGLPLNKLLRTVISYSGYAAYRQEFTLNSSETMDLGTLILSPSSQSLEEVLVIAERPPVTVRHDTNEFNASSFKTLPTALVEDLLKKLPGVQVDAEGNITANGKRVNRIMVDGKAFFGDDPKMATRNLPANVIEKVQLTDDKDEINRNTDGDLTNVGQVINLTLKKGVKKGWFGKLYAGAGTGERYEAGGIANIYRDTMQLSLIAFSNNINRSGFSLKEVQDLGGFNRSGTNSMMVMNRGGQTGFALNGISFGGIEPGISRTSGAGFNLNHAPNKKKSFFMQYFFGQTKNLTDNLTNIQQFFNDTIINNRTISLNHKNLNNHTVNAGANLKPDSVTDFNFKAGYTYSMTDEDIDASLQLSNNKTGLISQGEGFRFNKYYANRYNHQLFFTRRSRTKKGRSFNLNNFVNYNQNLNRYITETENEYFEPFYQQRSFNQLRRQDIPNLSINSSASMSEPLSKSFSARFTLRYDYLKDQQDIGIYDKDILSSKYEMMDYAQSTGFTRQQQRINTYGGLTYRYKKISVTAGISGLWQDIENRYRNIQQPVNFNLFNIVPSASFQWKQLSGNYNMNVTAPSSNFLVPVPDSTNPFMIRVGNPYLKPSMQHHFYISNFNFFQASGTSLNFFMNGSFTDRDVIMKRTVHPNGAQVDSAVNANGSAQFYSSVGFGKEFKNKQKFIFSFRISPYVNYNRRQIIVNNNSGTASTFGFGPNINIGLNWNDIIEFRPVYSPGINRTTYSDPAFNDIKVITHYMDAELIIRFPKKLVWETNLAYRKTNQVAPGLPRTNVLWNAAVTLLMFKGDVGLLKLSVYDILDRNNGLFRYTFQNQVIDNQTNVLKRFAHLSFTYNIRNMGAPKKVGGRDRLFMF
ncbi:MAG: outer membrane beta-barrel protein [Flavisolibacter sp.]